MWPEQAFTLVEQNVTTPYLPPSTKPYTLVLDLDETLIHFNEMEQQRNMLEQVQKMQKMHGKSLNANQLKKVMPVIKFNTRPFARQFLKEMSKYYEIVVFTAAD